VNIEIIGRAAFMIENILVNAPMGVIKELKEKKKKLDDISIVIITHLHPEEYLDLPLFIYDEFMAKRTKPLVIIGPKALKSRTLRIVKKTYGISRIKLLELDLTFVNAESIQNSNLINDYRFSFINTKHMRKSYSLIIKNNQTSLGYTGGAVMSPGLSYLLKKVKNCIIDIPNGEKEMTIEAFKKISEAYNINFIPVGYPDSIESELAKINNTKMIKEGEQFYI